MSVYCIFASIQALSKAADQTLSASVEIFVFPIPILWHKRFGAAFRAQDINQHKRGPSSAERMRRCGMSSRKKGGLRNACWLDKVSDTNFTVSVLGKSLVASFILAGGFSRHPQA